MGHHSTPVRALGRNREEAERSAVHEFFHEYGRRHSLREVESATFLRKVPPEKEVREERLVNDWGAAAGVKKITFVRQVDDPDAPAGEWLEEWEFVLHTHT